MIKRFPTLFLALFALNFQPVFGEEAATTGDYKAEHIEKLEPTSSMRAETIYIVRCMEELHYQHHDVSALSNDEILTEYMSALDFNKLFFTKDDVDGFKKRFGSTLDIFIGGGSLTPAFTIFETYKERVNDRIVWVLNRLEQPFDFSTDETYTPDREKLEWPLSKSEADILWEGKIKYEFINELLTESTKKAKKDAKIDIKEETCEKKYVEAKETLSKRYKSFEKNINTFDSWALEELFLNSITTLYDPHSAFMSKDTYDDFNMVMHNSLVGIGALLAYENDSCIVKQIYDGSPADKSKQIKAGDKIVAVAQGENGEFVDIVGMRLNKSVKFIRGEKGTVVRLKIQPADSDPGDRKIVSLVRDHIELSEKRAHAKLFTVETGTKEHKIGLIIMPSFYGPNEEDEKSSLADDTKELILKLKNQGVEGIVIDVRNNGGGFIDQAVELTGLFIASGPVVMVKNSFGTIENYDDNDNNSIWDGRLITLTSTNSASASEIFVGALRDYDRALIVGSPTTHGKGSVQAVLPMDKYFSSQPNITDLGAAKITIQKWYRPTGKSTQLRGVESDINLESYDMYLPVKESDLPHALEYDSVQPANFNFVDAAKRLKFPVTEALVQYLGNKSKIRQETLEEFTVKNEDMQRFRKNVEQKEFSLNLATREEKKSTDNALKSDIKKKFDELKSKYDYKSVDVDLDAVTAKKSEKHNSNNEPEKDDDPLSEDDERYYNVKDFDVNLRESLRIMTDWLDIQDKNKIETSATEQQIEAEQTIN